MHRVSHLIQQLFVRVIIHVANNLPLLQLALVKVVPGLKMSANRQDRYHSAHLLHQLLPLLLILVLVLHQCSRASPSLHHANQMK